MIAAHGSMSASESPAERCSAGHDMNLRPKKRAAKDEEDSKEDVQGRKAAKGSCHCCGGMLKRNPDFAKVCGTCGARFHTYDCGRRRGNAGFRDFSECLRVSHIPARTRRGSRPGTGAPHQPINRRQKNHLSASTHTDPAAAAQKEAGTHPAPFRPLRSPKQCSKMCACVDGPVVCHVTALRQSRQAKRSHAGSVCLAGPTSGPFGTDPSSKSGSFDLDPASESGSFDLGKETPSLHAVAPLGSDYFDGPDEAFGCEEDDAYGFDAGCVRPAPADNNNPVRVAAAVSKNPATTQSVAGAAGGFVKYVRHEWLPVDLGVENEALRREVEELRREEEYLRSQLRLARREAKSMVRAKTLSDISDMVRKEREGGDRPNNLLPATVAEITDNAWTTEMTKTYKEQADWAGLVKS